MQARVLRMRYGHPRYTGLGLVVLLLVLLICVLVTDVTKFSLLDTRTRGACREGSDGEEDAESPWQCPTCSGHGHRQLLGLVGPCVCEAGWRGACCSRPNECEVHDRRILVVSLARAAIVVLLLWACHGAGETAAEGLRVWEPPQAVLAPDGGLTLELDGEGESEQLVFSWHDAERSVDASMTVPLADILAQSLSLGRVPDTREPRIDVLLELRRAPRASGNELAAALLARSPPTAAAAADASGGGAEGGGGGAAVLAFSLLGLQSLSALSARLRLDAGNEHAPNNLHIEAWVGLLPRAVYSSRTRERLMWAATVLMPLLQLAWACWAVYSNVGVVHDFFNSLWSSFAAALGRHLQPLVEHIEETARALDEVVRELSETVYITLRPIAVVALPLWRQCAALVARLSLTAALLWRQAQLALRVGADLAFRLRARLASIVAPAQWLLATLGARLGELGAAARQLWASLPRLGERWAGLWAQLVRTLREAARLKDRAKEAQVHHLLKSPVGPAVALYQYLRTPTNTELRRASQWRRDAAEAGGAVATDAAAEATGTAATASSDESTVAGAGASDRHDAALATALSGGGAACRARAAAVARAISQA